MSKREVKTKKPIVVSLFSGAMGLDIGLERAGFNTVLCNEIEKYMADTIKLNKPNLPVINDDVTNITGEQVRKIAGLKADEEIDLLSGGPPCQAFSVYGKRKGLDDPRGLVIYQYVRMVKELQPKVFLMENVRGLLSMKLTPESDKGSLLKDLQNEFGKLGYSTECYVVNSVNYGAPQIRERIIVIGNKYGLKSKFPERTHSEIESENLKPFRTIKDAFANLDEKDPQLMDFSPRKMKYLKMVSEGENWRSLPVEIQKESMGKAWYLKGGRSAYWRRLSRDFPSPTVVTMPNHAGTSMCHPTEDRALTVREYARIQEFPDTWQFAGQVSGQYKQIGNAVPVRLGEVAGECVKDLLDRIPSAEKSAEVEHAIIHIRPHVRTRQYFKNGQKTGSIKYGGGVATFYKEEKVSLAEDNAIQSIQLGLLPA